MALRILVLGAGFGGLELATTLSEELGAEVDVTLVDREASFSFGFTKLDVLVGHTTPEAVRLRYRALAKPGVRFVQAEVTAIDPERRRVTTSRKGLDGEVFESEVLESDVLVVALGADYDIDATPGLADVDEFYSFAGAATAAASLAAFRGGEIVIGICDAPYKCPPAPSECALMVHDHLVERGLRGTSGITLVTPLASPVPPSPETSQALVAAFEERGIAFLAGRRVSSIDSSARTVGFDDGSMLPYDLFLGVPRHRAPDVVRASGMTVDGYVPVEPDTLETGYDGVYALGDVAAVGVPKAGVFAEGAARTVAAAIVARVRGTEWTDAFDGRGSCYIEFGGGLVGRVDVDFFSGPRPTGVFHEPSSALTAEKVVFGSSRAARWFGEGSSSSGGPGGALRSTPPTE